MKITSIAANNNRHQTFGKLYRPKEGDKNYEAFNKYLKARVNTEEGPKLDAEKLFDAMDKSSEKQGYDITLTPKTEEDKNPKKQGYSVAHTQSEKIKTVEFEMIKKGEQRPVFHSEANYKNFMRILRNYGEHVRLNIDVFRKDS